MIHYHGGPITPDTCAIRAWKGRHAFISYAHHGQIGLAAEYCQSFALDNGAFSFWKAKKQTDWAGYYRWVAKWRRHPGFDFAVIPDVIDGSERDNDELAEQWPFAVHEGAVVWHVNESIERLARLARKYPIVCIGSSGKYDVSRPAAFLARMNDALPAILDSDGYPICKLHGLRMLNPKIFTQLPLATADSTNVARNIGIDSAWRGGTYQPASKETRTAVMVERIESYNSVGSRPDLAAGEFNRLLGYNGGPPLLPSVSMYAAIAV
jgi:hypothetical protein